MPSIGVRNDLPALAGLIMRVIIGIIGKIGIIYRPIIKSVALISDNPGAARATRHAGISGPRIE